MGIVETFDRLAKQARTKISLQYQTGKRYKVTQEFSAKKSNHGDFEGFLFQPDDIVYEGVLRYAGILKKDIRVLTGNYIEVIDDDYILDQHALVLTIDLLKDWMHKGDSFKLNQKKMVGVLKVTNYLENVETFWKAQPFFYDKSKIWWLWSDEETKWEMVDEVDMMNILEKVLGFAGDTVISSIKNNYLETFKRIGRMHTPKDAPRSWVQFKDEIFDYDLKITLKATPDYFVCNPIPWNISESSETPTMDKLFEDWVGKEYVQTLYEIIAYCTIIDYPIHLMFCFIGCGRNGKSKFQQLLNKFVGLENNCSTELDLLIDNRFESAKLYKKLVCTLGETNFGVMNKTSLLKKLCGQDLIGYEFKNKNPFDDINYAKILINSNSLPSSEDTSEGFYRRWMIIDFPNTFPEGKDILQTIPDEEYACLAKKCSEILPKLIESGSFTNQGTISERQQRYIMASNPLPTFINMYCELDVSGYCLYSELYTNYVKFLNKLKKRIISWKEFNVALLKEGLEKQKTSKKINGEFVNAYFVIGINLVTVVTIVTENSTLFTYEETKLKPSHNSHNCHNGSTASVPLENEVVHYNCSLCGDLTSRGFHKGKPYCTDCLNDLERQNIKEELVY